MNVRITDSFTKSLKTLIWHQHPVYKTWEFFRYKIPAFFKNIWLFRKELYTHRWWDYHFTLEILKRSIEINKNGLEKYGIEVDKSRIPKVDSMNLVIQLLNHKLEDNYIERAEASLGKLRMSDFDFKEVEGNDEFLELVDNDTEEDRAHNRQVFELARAMEETEWSLIWSIIKGTEFSKKVDEEYDGSDLRSWWD